MNIYFQTYKKNNKVKYNFLYFDIIFASFCVDTILQHIFLFLFSTNTFSSKKQVICPINIAISMVDYG